MQRANIEILFYETYYFANVVRNILHDQFAYIRLLNEFYGDGQYLNGAQPFQKYSAFHRFIEYNIYYAIDDNIDRINLEARQLQLHNSSKIQMALDELQPSVLPIDQALNYYGIEHESFDEWLKNRNKGFLSATDDDVSEYYQELRLEEPFERLMQIAVQEVFFILFQNRNLLLLFNEMIAGYIEETEMDSLEADISPLFAKSGVLKRVDFPAWVKRAVLYRDRGQCVVCHRDLTGTINISAQENFDHIVPLAKGGLNDVTNVQLLCRECNLKKHDRDAISSNFYEAWYPMSED